MRTINLVRATAMALALAAPVMTASATFAQSQAVPSFTDETGVTHYGYFNEGDQICAGLEPSIQQSGAVLARGPSTIATDAGNAADPQLYNPEGLLNEEGGNAP